MRKIVFAVRFHILFAAGLSLFAGCYVPENFSANADVRSDGSYRFEYTGDLVFALAAQAAAKGKLSASDEAKLKSGESELLKDKRFLSAKYTGKARYAVHYISEGNIKNGSFEFLSERTRLIKISYDKAFDQVLISGTAVDQKTLDRMKEAGVACAGELVVTTDSKVVETNGEKRENGSRWCFSAKPGKGPRMVIRLK